MAARKIWCVIALLLCAQCVSADCPPEEVYNYTTCSFRYRCSQNVQNARLPDYCQASNNFPVYVDLYLTDVVEQFDLNDQTRDFLKNIVTLHVTIDRPYTDLAFLKHMTALENFYMVNSNVDAISNNPFYYHTHLHHIDLSHNKLSDVDELFEFEETNKVKFISLAYNNIKYIDNYAFAELTSLVELDLSHNQLTDLTEEPFQNLTKLQTLRLNNNAIINLNGAVNNLTNLQHLYLSGNQLENIDEQSLFIIYHLKTIDMSKNRLNELTPNVFLRHWSHLEGSSVCKIILSNNQITVLPNATSDRISFGPSELNNNMRFVRHSQHKHNVQLVTNLDMSNNEISHIEYNAFHTIVYLTSLDLSHNKLIDFQVNNDDIMYVKFLNLSNNYLTTLLYDNFSPMTQLVNLDLSHNMINNIPEETLNNNIKLKTVNLAFNKISELNNLRLVFHSDGGYLDLSENELRGINIPTDEALQLTMLSLHSNKIIDAADVNIYDVALKYLIMSNNKITKLDTTSLRLPLTLVQLDLSFNEIGSIQPSTFVRLTHLIYLNLAHNKLDTFYSGVFHGLRQLKTLDLTSNKISYLDSKSLNDMKSLEVLMLANNGMQYMDYNGWINHKTVVKAYIDGNSFTCDWVGTALREYDIGFSKMLPRIQAISSVGDTFEGIPCKQSEVGELKEDNKLLLTAQKILVAIREQTNFLRNYLWNNNSQAQKGN